MIVRPRKSTKVLKSTYNMKFVKREVISDSIIKETWDYFLNTDYQITIIRVLVRDLQWSEQHTYWACPDLGEGQAPIRYWLEVAKHKEQQSWG